ncbi:MAG: glycerophosphodiester phosphodiesterase [Candidatus Thalassarchaeaceae archaeon]|jgi:glycerophosphoryl diester phosphodiesterase|nr:glycerophosphodiester phosphodiesterase [Candidatus Thalassarchaeaceae archaeon]|tara:strand:+ start:1052 stop:1627 length:576 start_codon:yes stop_codon:yes gene_type:complete
MNNSGHRLGASGTKLENTIEGLRSAIEKTTDSKFKYWEFDIRESIDGIVFVFHDDSIDIDGELVELAKMTFDEIITAGEDLEITIPTFKEVVSELEGRTEKVMVEIKEVFSDQARIEIIQTISEFKNWKLMATPERFEKSFPQESRTHWSQEIHASGVELVRVGRHRVNLFKASESRFRWIIAGPKWLFGF